MPEEFVVDPVDVSTLWDLGLAYTTAVKERIIIRPGSQKVLVLIAP